MFSLKSRRIACLEIILHIILPLYIVKMGLAAMKRHSGHTMRINRYASHFTHSIRNAFTLVISSPTSSFLCQRHRHYIVYTVEEVAI